MPKLLVDIHLTCVDVAALGPMDTAGKEITVVYDADNASLRFVDPIASARNESAK